MRMSIVVTTYNSPDWLEKVAWGFAHQTHRDFELVIADDGSGPETAQRIELLRRDTGLEILHVWQEDDGFQKTKILNKAINAARTDYLLFTDGDCVPRNDYVAVHARNAAKGRFLSGGYFKLPMATSRAITRDDIASGRAFDVSWLRANGVPLSRGLLKLAVRGTAMRLLNAITPTRASWNGHNASGWKADIVAVNGYDERMQWGGLDRELGERLENHGVHGVQLRYSAVCIHLDHPRGYKSPDVVAFNREIRHIVKTRRRTWTEHGLVAGARPA
ncbi:MAG: glycosyltransferase family 2 protein [Gammaproteobacteria bacterium]